MDSKVESRRLKDNSDKNDARIEKKSKKRKSRSRTPNDREKEYRRKRKHSRSRSPIVPSKHEKRRDEAYQRTQPKEVPARKPKETDMLNTRTGGAYIPPARLRMMQSQITDKSSVAYQRLAWEALKKSIHGHINKINVGNIGIIIKELLKENIVRGRGLLCRSVIQAQAASPTFTNVYAALVAAVNSRFPNIGELLLKRLVIQFKRGFKRNDKSICISSASFIAHLVNQRVAHEILALELLTLLVETPTDDSVEVAISFLKECGQKLTEVSSKGVNAIFEMLRNILHEGQLDKRVQYMIEVMFQIWKDGFKDHPSVLEELELVPEEEQFTHLMMLDDATDSQDILNVFKFDEKYEENEQKYKALSNEILGSDAESGEEDGSEGSGSEESQDEEEEKEKQVTIIDNTETNLVALRRTIYLTINSSLDFEECAHKLMKMQLKPGQEIELCHMFLDCCAEQRTYEKFYGLLAQRFCNINRIYISPFEEIFKDSYATAHRLDTNRLRNVSKFFAHLLFTDSISWEVLECVKLNEEDTTSSSRIYIKILFQELAEYMGLKKLNDRLQDPTLQIAFSGIFPRDNPKNTRFSINFFTSIGLGGLTDELREHLKQMPKNVPTSITEIKLDSDSSSDSSSSSESSSSSSGSSSSDEDDTEKRGRKDKKNKKTKAPQIPETEESGNQRDSNKTDRWGHDGFYDTYGNNARRMEPNQQKDVFVRPRQVGGNGRDRSERDVRHSPRSRHNDGTIAKNNREESNKRRDDYESRNKGYQHQSNRSRNDENYTTREHRNRNDKQIDDAERRDRDVDKGNGDRNRNASNSAINEDRNNIRNSRNKGDRINDDDLRKRVNDDSNRVDKKKDNSERYTNNESHLSQNSRTTRDQDNDEARRNEQGSRGRDDNRYFKKSSDIHNRDRVDSVRNTNTVIDGNNERHKDRDSRNKKIGNDDGRKSKINNDKHHKNRDDDERNNSSSDDNRHNSRNDRNKKDRVSDNKDRKNRERNNSRDNESQRKEHNDDKRNSNKSDKYKQTQSKLGVAQDKNSNEDSSDEENSKQNRREEYNKEKRSGKEYKINRNSDKYKSEKYDKRKKKYAEHIQKSKENSTTNTSDDEESENRDLGNRYWDSFEIESKSSKKVIESGTPEKNNTYYERRREC